ncbi:MAG TPA: hypothetical protein VMU94_09115 [Streptosporangiaceae bacterium]|nr:hypothetical protein [Streptosporangiaceae bacterium]
MKRRELLAQMARIAKDHGIAFDQDHPVHGGNHDKFFVGSRPVVVPRHNEIVEYTARGILRTFERMCAEQGEGER